MTNQDKLQARLIHRPDPTLPIAKVGRYTLTTEGDRYIMQGAPSGTHSLDIENTDADRLAAHWAGYTAKEYLRIRLGL